MSTRSSAKLRHLSVVVVSVLAVVTSAAHATFPDTNASKQYIVHVEQSCAAFVDSWIKRPEMAALQAARKLEPSLVCACAKDRLSSDARLTAQLKLPDEEFKQRVQSDALRFYMLNRILQTTLACFASEMNTSLEAMDPAK